MIGMKNNEENNQNEEEDNNAPGPNLNQATGNKRVELTEEQRRERASIVGKLFEDKEDLIKARAEREKKKREEIIELQSGARFTIDEVMRIVSVDPRPYDPLFPYSVDFFKQLYRLYYPDRDYKEYPKPYYFHVLFKQLIYDRFDKSVYTALDYLNPLIKGKCRVRKLFQHLNPVGQTEEVQFRDDVIKVAKTIPNDGDSYSFRKKMWEIHKVPYQLDAFKEKKA
jgi:hypothetical protein